MADPIYTDSVWLRQHSSFDSDSKTRTNGEHFIYYNTPNRAERLEMIYRSIGKPLDWDLEKYRQGNKHIDKGNKRRFLKNIFRFIKHPISYTYWRFGSKNTTTRRITHYLFFFIAVGTLLDYLTESKFRRDYQRFRLAHGQNPEGDGTQRYGLYDNELGIPNMIFQKFLYSPVHHANIIPSQSADQGYRKHFDLRRKYGLNSV